LKFIDENLKSHPKYLWKCVSKFRKKDTDLIQFEVNGTSLTTPYEIADAFSKHFQSVHSNRCLGVFSSDIHFMDVLSLGSISDSDVQNAIKRLQPSKSVEPDGILSFVIKGCSEVFVPVLKFIFNLSLSQHKFPTQWKQVAAVPVFKKGNRASVSNYRPISILNNFSKVFEYIMHDHVSHYFTHKLNPCQHGFTKSKSTVTNLVTYLDFVTPLVCSHHQVAVYFDPSSAFDLVPHSLLHKVNDYGLFAGYINWFHSYIINRLSCIHYSGALSQPYKVLSGVRQGSVLGPLLFNVLLMTCVTLLNFPIMYLLFADDKNFSGIKTPHDCSLIQMDINSIYGWCTSNYMKINVSKTGVISFTRKS
jgi:hypothetical protein